MKSRTHALRARAVSASATVVECEREMFQLGEVDDECGVTVKELAAMEAAHYWLTDREFRELVRRAKRDNIMLTRRSLTLRGDAERARLMGLIESGEIGGENGP